MSGVTAIVQFPHPGAEHAPPHDWMPWNTGPHRRKFMVSPGQVLRAGGQVDDREVVFWGEWEAPSAAVRRWGRAGDKPTVLHRPCVGRPPPGARQNTDPWVFGDAFLYSNCKQLNARPMRTPSAMQRLARGAIVFFGSATGGRFVLDTLLVIGEVVGTFTANGGGVEFDPTFQLCTVDSLTTDDTADMPLTLYRGATPAEPMDGMFSFVPCMDADDPRERFERPAISIPGIINPTSRQSPSGAKVSRSLMERQTAWYHVQQQVFDCGLSLGTRLAVPERCPALDLD